MMPRFELLQLLFCLPLVLSYASFPLTAIPHYSELSPCAASYMGDVLGSSIYRGCTSATPISAYGSCLCAQRLSSINYGISFEFRFDAECSSTSVQSFVTAFCDRWGVDLAAKAGTGPVTDTGTGTTTAVGGNPTGSTDQATPGSVGDPGQPESTSTSSSDDLGQPTSAPTSSNGSPEGGPSDNKVTIIASVVGSVAGVIAVVIAWLTYKHMTKGRHNSLV